MDLKDKYHQNPYEFLFLIYTLKELVNAKLTPDKFNLIFNPKPSILYTKEKIINILKEYYPDKIQDIILKHSTEEELKLELGNEVYQLFHFIVFSNKTKIAMSLNVDSNKFFGCNHLKLYNLEFKDGIKYYSFDVDNPIGVENEFDKSEWQYFFHGTSIYNWYSILRNGIKIMSGTSLMAHGAVYGSGVYLSDSFETAYQYCRDIGIKGIGVFKVKKEFVHKHTPTIFTVKKEEHLLLKYIIITNGSYLKEIQKDFLARNFNDKLFKENNFEIVQKRLTKEKSRIETEYPTALISCSKASLSFNLNLLELEFDCYNSFPFKAPIIRIVQPVYPVSDFLSENGIINLSYTSIKEWKPNISLKEVIKEILILLKDLPFKNISYSQENFEKEKALLVL